MSAACEDLLVPDLASLSGIPELNDITTCKYRIISNSPGICTTVVEFDEDQSPRGLPTHLIIRFEKSREGHPLLATAAIQRLAHQRLPHVVPKVWGAGHTQTETGTRLTYMLSQFYMDTCTLDTVWDDMDKITQYFMAKAVVSAVFQLRDISLVGAGDEAQKVLRGTPFERTAAASPALVGGPAYGYFPDFESFLMAMVSPGSANYSVDQKPDGAVTIQMQSPEGVGLGFARTDLDLLTEASGLCHNSLDPRNILVRQVKSDQGKAAYQFVSVIGWAHAGFLPLAAEIGFMDMCLGLQNQSWTWYSVYREHAGTVLAKTSPGAHHICLKLIRAMVITDLSRKDSNKLNVGNLIQRLWHEREKTGDHIAATGYVKNADAERAGFFTAADNAELELEALRRLGYVR
ncbi:hypothetical protein CTA2_7253 [Colletotrichum tanaceti]|uniref:Aminoglycoside phosphotransferase domain-containing protein n=1 Tax=Colletotrichum tanaceti TaxID=1306861 RepID=A0A4U6XDL6_9PEZI|nr:hypothetical protein CTA2_7253 [Colletotrichum tanaceti]TKW53544.1 hypothetical protein CTA1_4301 [Colletotrichum tanaceti]